MATPTDEPMRVLVAAGAFKGSLGAVAACQAIARGLTERDQPPRIRVLPVADGGDGTLDVLERAGFTRIPAVAVGPLGEPVTSAYVARGKLALVELADACGLARLGPRPNRPLEASSAGAGLVLAAAMEGGYRQVVLAVGGSASTDGGLGLLVALGARVRDEDGRDVAPGLAGLERARSLDLSGMHAGLETTQIILASDVDAPLLGPGGAAAVFGPQKGLGPRQIGPADAALARWADLVEAAAAHRRTPGGQNAAAPGRMPDPASTGTHAASPGGECHCPTPARDLPGAGAAGGVGFAALAALGATRRSGFDLVAELIGLDSALAHCDLVITGEGSLDAQSLAGKAPVAIGRRALAKHIPALALCGSVTLLPAQANAAGFAACHQLLDLEPDVHSAIARASELLQLAARTIELPARPGPPRNAGLA